MVTLWHLTALTAFSLAGAGIYTATIFSGYFKGQGGEIRPLAFILALVFLCASLITTTMTIGNPARIINILGNPKAGFSIAVIASFLLIIAAIYLLFDNKTDASLKQNLVGIIGLILVILIYFGVSKMYMKPARPALYHWSVPIFLLGYVFSAAVFGYLAVASFMKLKISGTVYKLGFVAIFIEIVAVVGFLTNLLNIGSADRALDFSIVTTGHFALYFYLFVIICGLILPLVFNFLSSKGGNMRLLSLINLILTVASGTVFAIILNTSIF